MRRVTIMVSAALILLAIGPAGAAARHHRRHHSRIHHSRIERFGRDWGSAPTTSNSADNAGTVNSFTGGILTITLNNGSMVSGAVTGDTELECMAPAENQTVGEDGDGGSGDQSGDGETSGSGDNQAQSSGDDSSGEDQGDAAEQNEQAEDQNENEDEAQNCSSTNLAPGTIVREAVLSITGTGSVWKKVELGS